MLKYVFAFIAVIFLALLAGAFAVSRMPKTNTQGFSLDAADASSQSFDELMKGTVTKVVEQDAEQSRHLSRITATLEVKLMSGSQKGETVTAVYDDMLADERLQKVSEGDAIVVGRLAMPDETSYVMVDRYRLPYLAIAGAIFLALAAVFGRARGLTSVAGLMASIAILVWFVTPNILAGKNPALVTLVGAGLIALVSMFLAHGFNRRTSLAVIGTLLALGAAEGLAYAFIMGARLLGNGSEEAFYLQTGYFGAINLQGLLLGGIIIGTLGVLNDVTTAQSATVEEIHTANLGLSFGQLYNKGSSVGREHIASLINTLVLTYVGASLPLFLLFTVNTKQLWTTLNSSTIAEEIVRTLAGSIALIIAVPITTALAAWYFRSEFRRQKTAPSGKKIEDADDYWDRANRKIGN